MPIDPEDAMRKLELEDELAEYFIQCRENDINKLTPKSTFKINIRENILLAIILEKEREKFRKVIRKGLLKAFIKYKMDEERLELISKILEVFADVKIEIKIPKNITISEIRAEKHEGKIITFPAETYSFQ